MIGGYSEHFPRLEAMSQQEAQDYQPGLRDFCISIRSGKSTTPVLPPFAEVCAVVFDDVPTFDGGSWAPAVVISQHEARKIAGFVERIHAGAETLIIHCGAGVSRSVSVAMALSVIYRRRWWRPSWMDTFTVPNPPVFAAVIEACATMRYRALATTQTGDQP